MNNKITEDEPEPAYFDVLRDTFEALNEVSIPLDMVRFWFEAQLLRLSSHTPNLQTDSQGNKLLADERYEFSYETMSFMAAPGAGKFNATHIKFLRLVVAGNSAAVLANVQGGRQLANDVQPIMTHLTTLAS